MTYYDRVRKRSESDRISYAADKQMSSVKRWYREAINILKKTEDMDSATKRKAADLLKSLKTNMDQAHQGIVDYAMGAERCETAIELLKKLDSVFR